MSTQQLLQIAVSWLVPSLPTVPTPVALHAIMLYSSTLQPALQMSDFSSQCRPNATSGPGAPSCRVPRLKSKYASPKALAPKLPGAGAAPESLFTLDRGAEVDDADAASMLQAVQDQNNDMRAQHKNAWAQAIPRSQCFRSRLLHTHEEAV